MSAHRRKPAAAFTADRLAKRLHDDLSQHLAGVAMATGALVRKLDARSAPETKEARYIVNELRAASREVHRLITWIDHGKPR